MKNIHLKKMVFIVALSVCLSQNLVAMDPEEKEIEDEVAETLMKIGIVKEGAVLDNAGKCYKGTDEEESIKQK